MDYILDAKYILLDHLRKHKPAAPLPSPEEIFIVKTSYSIGTWKVDMATRTNPGYLFQATHNPQFNETYLDVYVKESNSVYIDDGSELTEVTSKTASSRPDVDIPDCPDCGEKAVWSQGQFVCNNHDTMIRVVN